MRWGLTVFEETPIIVTSGRAPRWARRQADAPEHVLWIGTGPPALPLENRGALLRRLRLGLHDGGMQPDLALDLPRRTRRMRMASGPDVERHIIEDERRADELGMWWGHAFRWASSQGDAYLLADVDWDGHDLVFCAWGSGAHEAVSIVRQILETTVPPCSPRGD